MMLVPGVMLLLPGLLVLVDLVSANVVSRYSNRRISCSVVLGVPLVLAGVQRLRRPEDHRGHRGDE